jgi:hypothetical protein
MILKHSIIAVPIVDISVRYQYVLFDCFCREDNVGLKSFELGI